MEIKRERERVNLISVKELMYYLIKITIIHFLLDFSTMWSSKTSIYNTVSDPCKKKKISKYNFTEHSRQGISIRDKLFKALTLKQIVAEKIVYDTSIIIYTHERNITFFADDLQFYVSVEPNDSI